MAKIHVLESQGSGNWRVVYHLTVPGGNNSAGVSWADCMIAQGMNTTCMVVGSGGGQITQVEATNIAQGSVYEIVRSEPLGEAPESSQAAAWLRARHAQYQTEQQTQLGATLRYFGATLN